MKANQLFVIGHKGSVEEGLRDGGHLDGVLAIAKVGETIRKFLGEQPRIARIMRGSRAPKLTRRASEA